MIATATRRRTLRLGTRGSVLARMQSRWVASQLQRRQPGLKVQLVVCRTTGDDVVDRPLHDIGGKGLFTKELEEALLDDRVDLVVHSMKDVPVTMPLVNPAALTIAAIPWRADARDVLVTRDGCSLRQLHEGAVVATGSLRRRCQLLHVRSDLTVASLRGNIDTRLRRVESRAYDGIVLACAGLRRAGLFNPDVMSVIPVDDMLPAAGQGALALQCRADDRVTRAVAAGLDDAGTRACVEMERAIVRELGGDCHSPIAAYATLDRGDVFHVRAVVGTRGGRGAAPARAEARGDATTALSRVMQSLTEQHAQELLIGCESTAIG